MKFATNGVFVFLQAEAEELEGTLAEAQQALGMGIDELV